MQQPLSLSLAVRSHLTLAFVPRLSPPPYRILLVYNHSFKRGLAGRSVLAVAISKNDGGDWKRVLTLEVRREGAAMPWLVILMERMAWVLASDRDTMQQQR